MGTGSFAVFGRAGPPVPAARAPACSGTIPYATALYSTKKQIRVATIVLKNHPKDSKFAI